MRAFFGNRVVTLVAFGGGATQFMTYGLGNFAVLFLMKEKGMTLTEVASFYSLVIAVGMCGSMITSGMVLDRWTRRKRRAFALAPAGSLALVMLAVSMFFSYFYLGACIQLVQEETPPNQRVLAGALMLLVMNFIGLGLGPTWVGQLSDWFAGQGASNPLQLALSTLAPAYLVAIGLFLALDRVLARYSRSVDCAYSLTRS